MSRTGLHLCLYLLKRLLSLFDVSISPMHGCHVQGFLTEHFEPDTVYLHTVAWNLFQSHVNTLCTVSPFFLQVQDPLLGGAIKLQSTSKVPSATRLLKKSRI